MLINQELWNPTISKEDMTPANTLTSSLVNAVLMKF